MIYAKVEIFSRKHLKEVCVKQNWDISEKKEEIFNFTVCSVGCFTLGEGIRTSNETLSKIAKYHFVENSKISFQQSYSEIIFGRLPMD